MRAYATIVKDSFHEALVSKTMWFVLVKATLILLALAPIGIVERGPTRFDWNDIRERDALAREINRQAAEDKPSPGKRIVEVEASSGSQLAPNGDADPAKPADRADAARVGEAAEAGEIVDNNNGDDDGDADELADATPKPFPKSGDIWSSLNAVVQSRELYDAAAWADYELGEEASGLIERGVDALDDGEVARLNRLLLETAFGRFLKVADTKSYLGYAGWYMDDSLFADKSYVLATALTIFTDYFLGVAGIMTALVLTSTFVPRTFETGAVDLLLSKPVSRSLVFLAKFVGGCAFITVISAYLIGGLYLIAGFRLDYWNHRFLWCVPLLLFLFAIYYSVSAMAGVLWRNAIVSIVVAVVFWAVCYAMGVTKFIFDTNLMMPQQVTRLIVADDHTFASFASRWGMGAGAFRRWDADAGEWVETFVRNEGFGEQIGAAPWESRFDAGPIYDSKSSRLFALGNLYNPKAESSTGPWVYAATAENGWRQQVFGRLTKDVRHLLVRPDGKLLGLASAGIVEIPTDAKPLADEQLKKIDAANALATVELKVAKWTVPSAAAAHDTTTDIAVYDPGRLRVLRLVDGKQYEVRGEYRVEPQAACEIDGLAFVGDRLVLGLFDGRILVFAVGDDKLDLLAEHTQGEKTVIKQVALAPDGKSFAVRCDDERVFWYDTDAESGTAGDPLASSAQGDVTAIAMSPDGELAAAYAFNHVVRLDNQRHVAATQTPAYGRFESFYWYGVLPIYTVFPKPGELGNLTAYLLHGKETVRVGEGPGAVEQKLDIYTPIWSNMLFLSVMLAIGCWYVSRRDF